MPIGFRSLLEAESEIIASDDSLLPMIHCITSVALTQFKNIYWYGELLRIRT
jgi:hypothetical protein